MGNVYTQKKRGAFIPFYGIIMKQRTHTLESLIRAQIYLGTCRSINSHETKFSLIPIKNKKLP